MTPTPYGWNDFLKVSYPDHLQTREAGYSLAWRLNRRIGLRTAYFFYRLGFSANALSAIRLLLAAAGVWMLGTVGSGGAAMPFIGVLLLAWQVNLDFADGVIARAKRTTGPVGLEVDEAANAFARAAVLLLLGFLTGSWTWFMASALASYLLVQLVPGLIRATASVGLPRFLRMPSSVVVMVILVPSALAAVGSLGGRLEESIGLSAGSFARTLVASYLTIAIFSCRTLLRISLKTPEQRTEL